MLGRPAHGVSAGDRGVEDIVDSLPFLCLPMSQGWQQRAGDHCVCVCGGGILSLFGAQTFSSCIQGRLTAESWWVLGTEWEITLSCCDAPDPKALARNWTVH